MPMDIQYRFESNPLKELRDFESLRTTTTTTTTTTGRKTKPIGYGAKT